MIATRTGFTVVLMLALVAAESACQRAPLGVALAVPAHAMSARAMSAAARHAVPFDTVRGAPDRWFARDKSLHFGASLVIQLVGYSAARLADARPTAALIGATALATSAGIGKEVYDARGHGVPSWRDLAWDGMGVGVGAGLVLLADRRE